MGGEEETEIRMNGKKGKRGAKSEAKRERETADILHKGTDRCGEGTGDILRRQMRMKREDGRREERRRGR